MNATIVKIERVYNFVHIAHVERNFGRWFIYNDWHWGNDGWLYKVEL